MVLTKKMWIVRKEFGEDREHPAMLAHDGLGKRRNPLEEAEGLVGLGTVLEVREIFDEYVRHEMSVVLEEYERGGDGR